VPFGDPVVPEVNWIWAIADGDTSGRTVSRDPCSSGAAMNSSQSAKSITSRSAGRSSRKEIDGGAHRVTAVLGYQEEPGCP